MNNLERQNSLSLHFKIKQINVLMLYFSPLTDVDKERNVSLNEKNK